MDAPRRLLGKRSRWPIALGLGVAVVGLCTYLLFTPRQFGFVGRYHGQRVPMPRFATDMARSLTDTMVELAPKKDRANLVKKAHADIDSAIKEEEARTEFYVFNDDPHKVLG
ncbi:MAG TPA: hypothetical protein VKT78_20695, partial [Fimbriimonadaceae bacterium]|nr:hypothetical protein [Fimbriimonadaceae bacterium]